LLWYGGSLTCPAPAPGADLGSLTIAANAALILAPLGNNGAAPALTLGRPLNLLGRVGWVSGDGRINVVMSPDNPLAFVNTPAMIQQGALADVPSNTFWNGAPGGYYDAQALAQAFVQIVNGQAVNSPAALARDGAETFLEGLPAIERAAVEVAYRLLQGTSLVQQLAGQAGLHNALVTGNRAVGGAGQFAAAAPVEWASMAAGVLAGVLSRGPVPQLFQIIHTWLTANRQQFADALMEMLAELQTNLANGDFARVAAQLFPEWVEACTRYQQGTLVSYRGGFVVGKALAQVGEVVAMAAMVGAGGAPSAPSLMSRILTAMRSAVMGTLRATGRLLRRGAQLIVRAGQAIYNLGRAAVTRAGHALIRLLPNGGQALANRLTAPFRSLRRWWSGATSPKNGAGIPFAIPVLERGNIPTMFRQLQQVMARNSGANQQRLAELAQGMGRQIEQANPGFLFSGPDLGVNGELIFAGVRAENVMVITRNGLVFQSNPHYPPLRVNLQRRGFEVDYTHMRELRE
jgi:hypothetical protein